MRRGDQRDNGRGARQGSCGAGSAAALSAGRIFGTGSIAYSLGDPHVRRIWRAAAHGSGGRLGDEGLALQRLARGEGNRLLRTAQDPLEFRDEMEPECTLDLVESVLLLIGRMLHDLCASLGRRSLATNEIHLRLKLERAPDYTAILRLPVPMLDASVF